MEESKNLKNKSSIVEREERILTFWNKERIFQKSLEKPSPKGEFVFYEGPPTANGKPGIHHLEARAFKDAIPRYKTMQGFHVRRKGGWDTHGLPVELAVEKELGFKSKKEIEIYGIDKFNQKCRESVWTYVDLWRKFTDRIGFWIDLDKAYVTYEAGYIESIWAIFKKINERGLLYKDYKVVPWCPRCGTALSSHELAQGYEDVKDLAVTVKFKLHNFKTSQLPTYLLAWTTTPWTLPGNIALAVNKRTIYAKIKNLKSKNQNDNVKSKNENAYYFIVAKNRLQHVFGDYEYEIIEEFKGEKLVGLEYEPLYPFLKDNLSESEKPKLKNAFKIYPADFVTTNEGTGIVHTAVMYGQDDFELGTKFGLPKHHLVKDDGTFKEETGFLAGKFVKDEATDVLIIKDLASRGLLFAKEKYSHSYPFCWRCQTPLIYFARDSWYIKMSALRNDLVKANVGINWVPEHIKDGRFGEWLSDVKDWAISRERYWGTPLPIWQCESCQKKEVVGSFDEIRLRSEGTLTKFILLRHGESEKNTKNLFSSIYDKHPLTHNGRAQAKETAKIISKEKIDAYYTSPVLRAQETAEIIAGGQKAKIIYDDRLREVNSGLWEEKQLDDASVVSDHNVYESLSSDGFYNAPRGKTGESWKNVEDRVTDFLKEILSRHKGKTVLLVSHEGPLAFLLRYLTDLPVSEIKSIFKKGLVNGYANPKTVFIDNHTGKVFNPHRPRIDGVLLACDCGGSMKRVKEVVDVWFDSGAMPFAQDADDRKVESFEKFWKGIPYPADFISEAIDQTRGWFYTLHAIGTLMGRGKAYKNVICLGHILDAEGKKMSKSLGNVVEPSAMIERYGADALRFWMYSVNQPGESKNFDEKFVDEVVKKVFNLASNVLAFYKLYADMADSRLKIHDPRNTLDVWIIARLNQLISEVTVSLDAYKLLEPTRAIRDFIADLSQWYLRRSRERIKSGGKNGTVALGTLRHVLLELSKLMAPFTPFFAEHLYQEIQNVNIKNQNDNAKLKNEESVHLTNWPEVESRVRSQESGVIEKMEEVRKIVSLGLEARAKAGVKVRQPLQKLKVKSKKLKVSDEGLFELIKDEVNVKEVLFDDKIKDEVELDIAITPELKEEGDVRELVRAIQEFRKELKLNPSDTVSLAVETDEKGRAFLEKYKTELGKATLVGDFVFEIAPSGQEIVFGEFSFRVEIKK